MKISIITPIYGQEKTLQRHVNSIENQNFPKANLELIFANDNSPDNVIEVAMEIKKKSKLDIKIINYKVNRGTAMCALETAKRAKYEHLIITNGKCEFDRNLLKEIVALRHPIVNCRPVIRMSNIYAKFLDIVRRGIYGAKYNWSKEDILQNRDNFYDFPTGATTFFCEKDLYLSTAISNANNKNANDDTEHFWNIASKVTIMRSYKAFVYYNNREKFFENVSHIYNRGPKFVSFYFKPGAKHFWLIVLAIVTLVVIVPAVLFFGLEVLGFLFITNILVSIYLSSSVKDFFLVFLFFPLFSTTFFIGILKGVVLKFLRKI